ncbi:hypothetical protein LINPERPRIM_LOCUS37802 [Linum perenne]
MIESWLSKVTRFL